LLRLTPVEAKKEIAEMDEAKLRWLHFGFGMYIRNNFGLWQGNNALLQSCEPVEYSQLSAIDRIRLNLRTRNHPDEVSTIIIKAFWKKLHETQQKDSEV
jgi:hypothetical protein